MFEYTAVRLCLSIQRLGCVYLNKILYRWPPRVPTPEISEKGSSTRTALGHLGCLLSTQHYAECCITRECLLSVYDSEESYTRPYSPVSNTAGSPCIYLWRVLNMWTQIWALACPSQHVTWESQVYMRKTQELSPTREQWSGTGIPRYRLNAVRRLFWVLTRGTEVSVSALRTVYTRHKSVLFTQSTFTNTIFGVSLHSDSP